MEMNNSTIKIQFKSSGTPLFLNSIIILKDFLENKLLLPIEWDICFMINMEDAKNFDDNVQGQRNLTQRDEMSETMRYNNKQFCHTWFLGL